MDKRHVLSIRRLMCLKNKLSKLKEFLIGLEEVHLYKIVKKMTVVLGK